LESVVTRTPSAGQDVRDVDSSGVVVVIVTRTMRAMRISARGATREAYQQLAVGYIKI
jgi:hypothetical protein